MRGLFYSFLGYFLTPAGLVVLGALDSSVIFFLPLGIDFALIILAAKEPELFWLYAMLATVGSLVGVAVTFWIGRKVGEHGLEKFIKSSRLERIQQRVGNSAAVTVAALGIIPPPFPFTAFVLTSGACGVNAWTFLLTLAGVRALRFTAEGALAARYGRGILAWMESTTFTVIIGALATVAIVGTIVSAVALYRGSKRGQPGAARPLAPPGASPRTTGLKS
jgi:membrane protein YqaA with SNARE-associated domain